MKRRPSNALIALIALMVMATAAIVAAAFMLSRPPILDKNRTSAEDDATATRQHECPDGMVLVPQAAAVHLVCYDVFEDELHPVDIQAFCIDRLEMTWLRYRACLKAAECGNPGCPQLGGDTLPVVCIDAHDADAACAFEGKRLPTAREVQYAAGGRTCVRWWEDQATKGPIDHEIVPVGTRVNDVSPFGVRDLRINAEEWTATSVASYKPYTRLRKITFNRSGSVADGWLAAIDDSTTTSAIGARCAANPKDTKR